ncbi:MAG TPA: hypothetical protein VK438_02440 [Xanthobacteraceae bacterium]|nr:hypothetical protein [Xanthobacteraceae bacterium]
MARDQDSFEWVNAWAEATGKLADAALPEAVLPEAVLAKSAERQPPAQPRPAAPIAARFEAAVPDDQLMRDIVEIERARDALAALPVAVTLGRRRTQALTLVAPRTSDPVPVVVGGVLALVMLTVFGAAAAMTKLAR